LKKCPRCNSISLDSEASCGVCGASLSDVASQRLDQFVHKETEIKPKKKSNVSALALIIGALTMTGAGAGLLVFHNGIGIILLLPGLLITVYIVGAPGVGTWGVARGGGRRSMQEAEARRKEEERKRRRGEGD
jgi:hypothetical protein